MDIHPSAIGALSLHTADTAPHRAGFRAGPPAAGDPAAVPVFARELANAAPSPPQASTATDVHQRFESMFLSQLISVMFNSSESGLGVDGTTGSVYAGWFSQAVAEQIAARGGLGLADQLAERGFAGDVGRPGALAAEGER